MFALTRWILVAALTACYVTESKAVTPDWFDANQYFFSFQGSMGPGDIDRVTPFAHSQLGGLTPGLEWFAWIDVGFPGVILSSWEGFQEGSDHTYLGFLGSDTNSSPVSAFGPAIAGIVRPDGGIYICVGQTGDEDCDRQGGFGGLNDYTFYLALAPQVPEPSTISFLMLAVLIVPLVRRSVSAVRR
jgi:hypothetical protein